MTWKGALTLVAVGAGLGLALGWQLWRPKPILETPAPPIVQKDGSTVLERRPDPTAKPRNEVPPGAVVERLIEITVTPRDLPNLSSPGQTVPLCPPMSASLSLVRMPNGTRRVVASSPDGSVSGVDIPVESAAPVKALRHAAGGSYYPQWGTYGVWAEKDYGPVRVGAEVFRHRAGASLGFAAALRVGLRW